MYLPLLDEICNDRSQEIREIGLSCHGQNRIKYPVFDTSCLHFDSNKLRCTFVSFPCSRLQLQFVSALALCTF